MISIKNEKRMLGFFCLFVFVFSFMVFGCNNWLIIGHPEITLRNRTNSSISVEWEPSALAEFYYLAIYTDPDYYNDFSLYDAIFANEDITDPAALGAAVAADDDNIKEIIYFESDETLEYTFNKLDSNTTYYIDLLAAVTSSTFATLDYYGGSAIEGDELEVTTLSQKDGRL